ncbi:NADAR family protein [Clostridium perfringens]|nr:Swarming motility protein ybiA [Clostridium perfringens]
MVKNFNENIWNERKIDIVVKGNIEKFSQNEELKKFLLNTKNKIIVEASPYDSIWGVGLSVNNENITNPNKWSGKNLLGFALMEVRDFLNEI